MTPCQVVVLVAARDDGRNDGPVNPGGHDHPQLDVVGEGRAQSARDRLPNLLVVGVGELEGHDHVVAPHDGKNPKGLGGERGDGPGEDREETRK